MSDRPESVSEIAEAVAAMTYGDLMELADSLSEAVGEKAYVDWGQQHEVAEFLHYWATRIVIPPAPPEAS